MPQQKDLKRIVRSRMQKTGESYSAARSHIVSQKPSQPEPVDLSLAGMAEEKVLAATGRGWAEWVALLDEAGGRTRPHKELAMHVASLGTPDWWSQTVVVGYERIRGLRARGQRMDATWEVSRSRTFPVPIDRVFHALADEAERNRWLTGLTIVRAASTKNKSVRLKFDDGSNVDLRLTAKDDRKTVLGLGHMKLSSKERAEEMKGYWTERLDALAELLQAAPKRARTSRA